MIPLAILTGMAEPTAAKGPLAMTLIPRVVELRGMEYDPGQNEKQRPWGEKCPKKKGSERGCENCRDRG